MNTVSTDDNSISGSGKSFHEDFSKESELDLIPTKITSVQPDPLLFLTPEKPLYRFRKKKGNNQPSSQANFLIKNKLEDPALTITPEKLPSLLKTKEVGKDSCMKPTARNKVRFNIPDSSDDTLNGSPSTQSICNDISSISTEFDEGSSHTTDDAEFNTRAAMYAQRNPLADITLEGNTITNTDISTCTGSTDFSSSTSSSSFQHISNSGSESSFAKVPDIRGKTPSTHDSNTTINPTKTSAITRIKVARSIPGHRKNTLAQQKIDKLTKATVVSKSDEKFIDANSSNEILPVTQPFLKKKVGLQRHGHSMKYMSKSDEDKFPCNELSHPKYNSSIAMGQKLQLMQEEKFDAVAALTKKLQENSELKAHVAVKAADGTNFEPDENLYQNLISVDVSLSDIIPISEMRRVKRTPPPPKDSSTAEPRILDAFSSNLFQEKVVVDSKCYSLRTLNALPTPLDSVMMLYDHSLSWQELSSF